MSRIRLVASCLMLTCGIAAGQTASLSLLGDLPGGEFSSTALAVSADGTIVVGYSNTAIGLEAFRWTAATGMVGLGDFAGGLENSRCEAISADGSMIVGHGHGPVDFQAAMWNANGPIQSIGLLPGGTSSVALGVSDDGKIIVGKGSSSWSNDEAYRWTASTGYQPLGGFASSFPSSNAFAISGDGSRIVGYSYGPTGFEACYWDEQGVIHGIGQFGGVLNPASEARATNVDGTIVVGASMDNNGETAFRWTAATGLQALPTAGNVRFKKALAVSDDGRVIAGGSHSLSGTWYAIIWTEASGTRVLGEVMENFYGLDLQGFSPVEAHGLSEDGRTVVGWGLGSNGEEAFIAYLPPCYADCNDSLTLDIFDYICFGNSYNGTESYADCDNSGTWNIFDYICFGNAYANGCH
ncbi:MAG: PEP-CTERM sorting domain-containing protein [Phycisphaeraceae bacterium]|nr:hypothetical protein [Phycisphaerales bacterium]MCB9861244.1 PEP-CTERM sorting domain-containing protein [Phycisphaeraceae bacterium]